jgi:phosphatidylglycerol:prolipoprotein diacylglycerol transferase
MTWNKPGNSDGSWLRGQRAWELSFLHPYSISIFLAIIASFLSVAYFWRRQKYSWENLQIILIIVIPSSILGARFWTVMAQGGWNNFFTFQGLSIHGALIGAIITGVPYIYLRRNTLDMRTVFSIILPNVILGQAIGRWGNFGNHEVYGQIVNENSLNWMGSMKNHMFIDGHYRQPLFFYEFLTSIFGYLFLILILLRKNWLRPGVVASLYLVWYGIVRISLEEIRNSKAIMYWGSIPVSYFIAWLTTIVGFIITIWFQFFDYKKYDLIKPIKTRREFFILGKSDKKQKYLFWGPEIPNKINIWIPHENENKWSKREINQGKRNKTIKNNKK